MERNMFKKILVVGIIFLFIGVGVQPVFAVETKQSTINQPSVEDCDVSKNSMEITEEVEKNVYIANHIGPGVDDWAIIDTVGWWHFDEGYGNIAYDSSAYDDNGYCSSTQWTTDTPDGSDYALLFSADYNSYVGVDDNPCLDFDDLGEDEGFMIDFYMKKTSTPTSTYAGLVGKQYYGGYLVKYNINSAISLKIWRAAGGEKHWVTSNTLITDNNWHHIVAVWDGTTMYLYIDDMTTPDNTNYVEDFTIGGTSKWLDIGNDWPTDALNPFDGKIDEVKISIICTNDPPNAPIIDGQTSGNAGNSYPYTFTSEDPNGDEVSYYIEWGDGDTTTWTEFRPSGSPGYIESHSWTKGTFIIQAMAKDIYGAESNWATLTVTMPRNRIVTYNSLFLRLLEQFPILQKILLLQR